MIRDEWSRPDFHDHWTSMGRVYILYFHKIMIITMKNKFKTPTSMNCLLSEEIGLHLGDGSMNYYNNKGLFQLRGHINDDKDHYILRIKEIYKHVFNIDVSLREMPSSGVYGFQIWSNELVNYKHKILGLPLGKKVDFTIPKDIIENGGFAKSFLRGYFDTDGCLYLEKKNGKLYPRIEMASISEKFFEEIRLILTNLGFKYSYYTENRKKYGWKELHKIIIRGNNMTSKWFSEIKPANPKHLRKFKKLKENGPARTLKSKGFVVSLLDI